MLLKEIPFIQHNPLIPLPGGNNRNNNGIGNEEGTAIKRFIVSADQQTTTNQNNIDGSINVTLSESTNNTANTSSTALVPLENVVANNTNTTVNFEDENYNLRALSSTYYNSIDDKIIVTNGIPDKGTGLIRISIRNAGNSGGIGDDDNLGEDGMAVESPPKLENSAGQASNNSPTKVRDIEVDISKLQVTKDVNTNSTLFESVVGTSVFVTHPKSSNDTGESENEQGVDLPLVDTQDEDEVMDASTAVNSNNTQLQNEEGSVLHLRLVDQYGTILTLTFSYPSLHPTSSLSTSLHPTSNNNTSFLLPLQKYTTNYQLNPHPGSIIENTNSICFPTNNSSVVFALNPHLYCVDFGTNAYNGESGDGNGEGWIRES